VDGALPAANLAAEGLPSLVAGDAGGFGELDEDGDRVPEAVAVEPAGDVEVGEPVVAGGQLLDPCGQGLHELGDAVGAFGC
jgi:hypothetical protein